MDSQPTYQAPMWDQLRKSMALVERTTLWQAALLPVVILLGAGMEAIGIGLIFPVIKLIADPSVIHDMDWLARILGPAVVERETTLLIAIIAGLFVVFVVKNVFLLAVYYLQARFAMTNMALLAMRLYRAYLHGPYSLHLSRNSADLMNNVFGAVNSVFGDVFLGFVTLASEGLLILGLSIVLIIANPELTLVSLLYVGLAVYVFFAFFKRRLTKWGERELEAVRRCIQSLQQGLHSIKEVKVLGREAFLLENFGEPRREVTGLLLIKSMMANAPRLWVETLMVAGVLMVAVTILVTRDGSGDLLATLALFAAAGVRLIPSMNRILMALNRIKNGTHALNVVHRDLQDIEPLADKGEDGGDGAFRFSRSLVIENLSFRYPNAQAPALSDINLVIEKGASIGLVGPSGSGKTTLVDIILGLLPPTSGRTLVDGVDIRKFIRAWRRRIGYVPQSNYLLDDTLRRNIAFGIADADIDEARIQDAVRRTQLEDLVAQLPDGLDTPLGERGVRISGGQRQRVGIARALYLDPDIIVLDEATSALDNETEREINNAIERLSGQKTLIIIAHRLSTVRKCDRLAFLKDGRVVDAGGFEELKGRNREFSRLVELSKL